MIARKISKICDIKVQLCTCSQVDPHGQFVCVYLPIQNCIKLVKVTQMTLHYLEYMSKFSQDFTFSDKESISAQCQIRGINLYNDYRIQKISISKLFQRKQFIGVSNLFTIKVFEIKRQPTNQLQQNKLSVLPFNQIRLSIDAPILNFNFCFTALYVSYYNRYFKIFQLDKERKLWQESQDLVAISDQFVRLNVYHSVRQYTNVKYQLNITKDTKNQIAESRNKQNKQKQSQPSVKTFLKLQRSLDQLNQQKGVTVKNKFYPNLNQPQIPTFIFQKTNDTLYKNFYNSATGLFMQGQICGQYQRPQQFQTIEEQSQYLNINQAYPMRYLLSKCQKYIICIQRKKLFSIRSKQKQWKKVIVLDQFPSINPFFKAIQNGILLDIMSLHTKYRFNMWYKFIRNELEIVLNAYSSVKNNENCKERFDIQIQLIVIHKKSRKKSPSKPHQSQKAKGKRVQRLLTERKLKQVKQNKQIKRIKESLQFKTQRFPVLRIEDIKQQARQIKWLSPTELLVSSQTFKLYYFHMLGNMVQAKIKKIYGYLNWRIYRHLKTYSASNRSKKPQTQLNNYQYQRCDDQNFDWQI